MYGAGRKRGWPYGTVAARLPPKIANYRRDRGFFPRAYGRPAVRRFVGKPWRFGGFRGLQTGRAPQERKVIDTALATYNCDTAGSVTLINGVATGTDYTNRIGRRIECVSVQMRGGIYPVDTTASPGNCRVMLVWDQQPNGALAAVTDVLLAANGSSFMNLNNRDRFRILYDKQVFLGTVSTTATQAIAEVPLNVNINVFKACKQLVTFGGTAATIGSIETGALLLVTVGDQTNASTLGAQLQATFRVRFTDA